MYGIVLNSLLVVGLVLSHINAKPLAPKNDEEAIEYLKKYAYMGPDNPDSQFASLTDDEAFRTALMTYQDNMGLATTGTLDAATLEMMSVPRCGMKDFSTRADITIRRKRRYALEGSRWRTSTLTYRFNNYSPDLTRTVVQSEFRRAFDLWTSVTNLRFRMVTSGSADIEILFAAGEHGDGASSAFDGRGGTLAHAYFPQFGGDAHFDEDESWTSYSTRGTNLFQVAVHELGHSLGLGHSNVRSSIMFPSYLGYRSSVSLDDDDVMGIQALYGPKSTTTPFTVTTRPATTTTTTRAPRPGSTDTPRTTPAPTNPPPVPTPSGSDKQAFCSRSRFDAIGMFNGDTVAFSGDLYAKLDSTGIAAGYPRRIRDDWPGITGNIDAVLDWTMKNRIYVFKGSQYWRYEPTSSGMPRLLPSYPRSIAAGFPGLPNDIDSAFVWSANGRSYAFKGEDYYRLQRDSGRVDFGYPKPASIWSIGARVEAAFEWTNEKTYFFSGTQYYRYDDNSLQVDQNTRIPYPRPINSWWLACDSGSLVADMEMEEDIEDEFIEVDGLLQDEEDDTTSGHQPLTYHVTLLLLLPCVTSWVLSR